MESQRANVEMCVEKWTPLKSALPPVIDIRTVRGRLVDKGLLYNTVDTPLPEAAVMEEPRRTLSEITKSPPPLSND